MHRFKITYNHGHEEIVTAKRYSADGLWIIFEDADKQEIYRINESHVRSIDRGDLSNVLVSGSVSA